MTRRNRPLLLRARTATARPVPSKAVRSAREVLLERARKYARPPVAQEETAGTECLGFVRSGESYMIETRYVIEVTSRALTRLPGAPPALIGLMNLRGEILPVFDLARVLGRTARDTDESSSLIVLGSARPEAAICVEALEGTSRLLESELMDLQAARAFVRGITKDARVVLDGRALLEGSALSLDAESATEIGSEVAS